ncbi:MAG: 2-hydroxyglutaryl-CoA dehydratase [Verrucomicrobia bacterium]|nr:2-hydroxyglutaryl-CoA dehydratase [Verrucomicrobiota bacterium]
MICAGIDAGSRTTKVVLVDAASRDVVASGVVDQGVQQDTIASTLLDTLLAERGLTRDAVRRTVATGYGRNGISTADMTITEITCQAVGVRRVAPECATIVDIGGQDSKLIRLGADGSVEDFAMNDRCAAGTGRFLEVVASRLGVTLDKLVELASRSTNPASISSMCVVFAESEIVGLLADGAKPEDIVAGVEASIARRVAAMAGRRTKGPVVFTGGVALVGAMRAALENVLGLNVSIAPTPQLTGALGAALLAARHG